MNFSRLTIASALCLYGVRMVTVRIVSTPKDNSTTCQDRPLVAFKTFPIHSIIFLSTLFILSPLSTKLSTNLFVQKKRSGNRHPLAFFFEPMKVLFSAICFSRPNALVSLHAFVRVVHPFKNGRPFFEFHCR